MSVQVTEFNIGLSVVSDTMDTVETVSLGAWVGVGTLDLFHDEDIAYAQRLQAAGVPCEVQVVEGAFHGFDLIAPKNSVSQTFSKSQHDWLRRMLGTTRP